MSRRLDDLCPLLRPQAFELVARLTEQGHHVVVFDTLRNAAEQAVLLARGVSRTMNSRHLPQTGCGVCGNTINSDGMHGLSHAIDLVPIETYERDGGTGTKLSWDWKHPAFPAIGANAKRLGLVWGGDWPTLRDGAHVQLPGGAERITTPQGVTA